ncbi:MAG TPA: glycosyltransferase [Verrucomicrobiae bacterium]|nr:glycosyltransferase [Verrucomicrobiae bacterium]
MSSPRVSAVIPLFNKERTVEAALRSAASQTLCDLEIIVVDDGSTDSSPALVQNFSDARVRLFRQENAGPGAARNRAVAEARGEYLAFLDADDEWLPDYLERAVGYMEREPDLAAVTFSWFDHPGAIPSAPVYQRRGLRAGIQPVTPDLPASLLGAMVIFMWPVTTIARTGVVRRFGGFYEKGVRFGEDGHLWIKVLLNAPVRFVMEPAAHFHREASSLSGNRRAMRPLEPFLTDPDDVRRVCPESLRDLLERWLCLRALKTSCTLAYWGHWREGAALRRRFLRRDCWMEPLNWYSCLATTPFGALAGRLDRARRNR